MANPGTKRIDPKAKIVGRYLHEARLRANCSRKTLAEKLGVTFQQIQLYETGKNHVPFHRLVIAGRFLEVSLEYFERGPSALPQSKHITGTLLMTPHLRRAINKIAKENWPNVPDAAARIIQSMDGEVFHMTTKRSHF